MTQTLSDLKALCDSPDSSASVEMTLNAREIIRELIRQVEDLQERVADLTGNSKNKGETKWQKTN